MKKRTTLYWLLPAVAGLALIVVAVLLSSWSPGGRVVAPAQANVTAGCQLQVEKDGQFGVDIPFQSLLRNRATEVGVPRPAATATPMAGDDNEIEFTIAVTSVGQASCGSGSIEVVDQLPEGLTCEDAGVVSNPANLYVTGGCGTDASNSTGKSEQISFLITGTLPPGEDVVLALVARDNTDEDCVTNRACAKEGDFDSALVNGTCDQDTVCRRHPRTPTTPTPTVTNTPIPPTATPFVPRPTATAKPLATLVPPKTGTGSDNGGWSPLTLALGIAGASLLLVSGAAVAKKRIR